MEDTRRRPPPEGLECLACRAEADARAAEVLLCAECLGRHHPTCWSGACGACGGTDALPVRARAQDVGPTVRVIAPKRPPRRVRVRKLRVALLLLVCAAVGSSFRAAQRPRPQVQSAHVANRIPSELLHELLSRKADVRTQPEPAPSPWFGDEARLRLFWTAVARAREQVRMGDLHGALADYDRAVALGPEMATAWVERSRTRGQLLDLAGARADAIRATELDPDSRAAWFQRGFRGGELGLWSQAEVEWSRTLELAPNDAWSWNNRGFVRAHGVDPHGAIADCTRALELEPGLAYAWNNRAWAKLRLGDLDGALKDVTRSLELDPRNAWAYETRARVKQALGHSALEVYQEFERCAATWNGHYPRADEVRQALSDLRDEADFEAQHRRRAAELQEAEERWLREAEERWLREGAQRR